MEALMEIATPMNLPDMGAPMETATPTVLLDTEDPMTMIAPWALGIRAAVATEIAALAVEVEDRAADMEAPMEMSLPWATVPVKSRPWVTHPWDQATRAVAWVDTRRVEGWSLALSRRASRLLRDTPRRRDGNLCLTSFPLFGRWKVFVLWEIECLYYCINYGIICNEYLNMIFLNEVMQTERERSGM